MAESGFFVSCIYTFIIFIENIITIRGFKYNS
jgi:hypothetical protein